jgi:hypothetical protein
LDDAKQDSISRADCSPCRVSLLLVVVSLFGAVGSEVVASEVLVANRKKASVLIVSLATTKRVTDGERLYVMILKLLQSHFIGIIGIIHHNSTLYQKR